MRQALLVVDVQPCFDPPPWLVEQIGVLAMTMPSVATVERHDDAITPLERQLGWKPAPADQSLVMTDALFVKNGYLPPAALIDHLRTLDVDRVLVCGIQADTCVLAAGFALFDAGLRPTLPLAQHRLVARPVGRARRTAVAPSFRRGDRVARRPRVRRASPIIGRVR